MKASIGPIAFMVGFIVAILAAIVEIPYLAVILAVLGIVVGFLNVTGKEAGRFLLAAVALMVAGTATLAVLPAVGGFLARVFENLIAFIAGATLIVAFRSMFAIAKN